MVQRPQQLMKSFSQLQIPCYYLNNPFLSRPQKGIKQINPFLYVFNDVDVRPFLKKTRPVVYFIHPDHIETIKQYRPALLVFDTVDEPSGEFIHLARNYHRALKNADVVLATSEKLYNMASAVNPHTYLVPNGCDYEYFSQAAGRNLPVPDEMKNLPRPIIGYMGAVASWCDLKLVESLAAVFSDSSIVMLGPLYNVSTVPERPNLHWLGHIPYERLVNYVQLFDVGIIPFKLSSMVEAVNPIKMWEYLAAGIPVVSTAFPEAQKYGELVLCSADEAAFMRNIRHALEGNNPDLRARRMHLAWNNSWSLRARRIVEIIERHLEVKGVSSAGRMQEIPPAATKAPPVISVIQASPQIYRGNADADAPSPAPSVQTGPGPNRVVFGGTQVFSHKVERH